MTTRPQRTAADVSRAGESGRHARKDHRSRPMLVGPAGGAAVRRLCSVLVLVAMDVTAIFMGIYAALAFKLWLQGAPIDSSAIWAVEQKALPVAAGTLILLFAKNRLYAPREQRAGAAAVLSGVTLATLIVLIVVSIAGWRFDTYYIFYSSWFLVGAGILALRGSYNSITAMVLDHLRYERRALLVGQPGLMQSIERGLAQRRSRRGVPYRVTARHMLVGGVSAPDASGEAAALRDALDPERIDEVILTGSTRDDTAVLELLDVCRRRGLRVRLAPTAAELLSHSVEAVPAPGLPLFELRPPVLGGAAYLTKRAFDVVASVLIGVVALPVLAVAAVAIKVSDGGPVIHRSRRVGVEERDFDCLKLRTMVKDAEDLQAGLEDANEADGALFKLQDDPRVTRPGRILRRFSIDEFPQLWNVIRGEMSLVGPRPLPLRDYELLDDLQKKRYLVLPGMTGLWQVSGRSDLSFDELMRLDFFYIESWSVWLDLTILARTVPVVLWRRGAY
ncbi:MAG: sugar transferase [Miltoncostaeaceae bacterium]